MVTTYRVIWTPPQHFAPRHRDFVYREAADHLATLCAAVDPTATVVTLGEEA